MKIFYLRKIELRCICTILTTAAYTDGFTKEIGNQSEISISIDCSIFRSLIRSICNPYAGISINELFQALGGD